MTDNTNNPASQDARNQTEAVRRLVVDGVAPIDVALDHVVNENAGRDLARRLNAQRGQSPKDKQ